MQDIKTINVSSGKATIFLTIGVLFWGISFTFVKEAMPLIDVYSLLAFRFFIASVLLSIVFIGRFRHYNLETFIKGTAIGFELAVSFILQTWGIRFTTASNTAFITGLCVVFVPVFTSVLDKKSPTIPQFSAVILAFAGLALITIKYPFIINYGDVFSLLCAVGFAIHIILISRTANKVDAILFAITQSMAVAVFCASAGLLFNHKIVFSSSPIVWKSILFLAVFATGFTYTAQSCFQKFVTEIKAVMIYSLEPVFAAAFAAMVIGEEMTSRFATGGVLILASMMLADYKLKR